MNRKQRALIAGLALIAIVLMLFWKTPQLAKPSPAPTVAAAVPATGVAAVAEVKTTAKTPAARRAEVKPKPDPPQKSTDEDDGITDTEDQNYFLGRWCNNDSWKETNTFFSLEFSLADNGDIKAVFANNGPFSETLNAKVSGNEADLYFESVEGSMSFNEAAIKFDAQDCSERVASATVIDQNSLEVAHFNDVCGYVSAPADALLLARLRDGETCIPD